MKRVLLVFVLVLSSLGRGARGSSHGGHSSGGTVHVRGYTRSDGTYVRPYTRSAAGSRGGSYTSSPLDYSFGLGDFETDFPPAPVRLEPPLSNIPPVKRTNAEPISITVVNDDPILDSQKAQAAKGFPEAQYALGMRYLFGSGVQKDDIRGRSLIKAAADQGCERAREKVREFNRLAAQSSNTTTNRIEIMDDTTKRGPADRSRVNVNEPWEVRYWCDEFGCTEQQLREAVRKVGVMVSDVQRSLGK